MTVSVRVGIFDGAGGLFAPFIIGDATIGDICGITDRRMSTFCFGMPKGVLKIFGPKPALASIGVVGHERPFVASELLRIDKRSVCRLKLTLRGLGDVGGASSNSNDVSGDG